MEQLKTAVPWTLKGLDLGLEVGLEMGLERVEVGEG